MLERSLTDILRDPTTIHFVPGTDDADLGDILVKNPQRTPDGFVWLSPDRKTETVITLVGKVVYGAIGDKTGPYFSLPDKLFVEDITPAEMARVKTGFAVRLINRDLVVDTLLSDELNDHNQAVLEFMLSVQENADKKLESTLVNSSGERPTVNIRPFLKTEDGNPFYVLPVVSAPLFPQFKGVKPLGVMRAKRQNGRMSLNPNSVSTSDGDTAAPPCITFGDLPDPTERYSNLKVNEAYRRYQMCIPPVFDINNNLVEPLKYRDMIPDGSLVAVRGKLKMYNIPSRDQLSVNRPYLFVFDHFQAIDDHDAWVGLGGTRGKRSRSPDGSTSTEPSPKRVAVADDTDDEL